MVGTQYYRKFTLGVFLQTEGWTLIVSVMSTHDVTCYVTTDFEYFKWLNQALLNYIFFSMPFTNYRHCRMVLWPMNIAHTSLPLDEIASQFGPHNIFAVCHTFQLNVILKVLGLPRDLCIKLLREFNDSDISHVTSPWPSKLSFKSRPGCLKNTFISEDFVNVRNMRCVWWNI